MILCNTNTWNLKHGWKQKKICKCLCMQQTHINKHTCYISAKPDSFSSLPLKRVPQPKTIISSKPKSSLWCPAWSWARALGWRREQQCPRAPGRSSWWIPGTGWRSGRWGAVGQCTWASWGRWGYRPHRTLSHPRCPPVAYVCVQVI